MFRNIEEMVNIPITTKSLWTRNKCNYIINDTIKKALKENNLIEKDENAEVYFPCLYDNISKEINNFKFREGDYKQKFFILQNADNITAKDYLWKHIKSHHGLEKALTMMPNTYVLNNPDDVVRFKRDYKPSNIYIMKKNIQRQEGLKITNNKEEILNNTDKDYVCVQELLQDPYLISGRKTNMRFYVLVVCNNENMDVYVYNDGFMYYTKELFKKGSLEDAHNITTGYIDRKVYEENPLTHEDLRKYLDSVREYSKSEMALINKGYKVSTVYFDRIYTLIKDIFLAYTGVFNKGRLKNYITFQLFGLDIAVSDTLKPMVMEVNKGPDLGAKDERDGKVKNGVVNGILKTLKIVENNNSNNFIKVLEIADGIETYRYH